MEEPDPDRQEPDDSESIDHGAHLRRIAIELMHLGSLFGTVLLFVREGMTPRVVGLGLIGLVLTIVVMRTRRPRLPGDPK